MPVDWILCRIKVSWSVSDPQKKTAKISTSKILGYNIIMIHYINAKTQGDLIFKIFNVIYVNIYQSSPHTSMETFRYAWTSCVKKKHPIVFFLFSRANSRLPWPLTLVRVSMLECTRLWHTSLLSGQLRVCTYSIFCEWVCLICHLSYNAHACYYGVPMLKSCDRYQWCAHWCILDLFKRSADHQLS